MQVYFSVTNYKMRYTREYLEPFVKRNTCVADVVRDVGVPASGGNVYHIGQMIRKHNIDTSHFDLKEARSRWKKSARGNAPKMADEILVYGRVGDRREEGRALGKAMRTKGVIPVCQKCNLTEEWQGERLTLHVDHIDCDWKNNVLSNLRFLCPNCHSQRPPVIKGKHPTSAYMDRR